MKVQIFECSICIKQIDLFENNLLFEKTLRSNYKNHRVIDGGPINFLFRVFLLLELEDMLVEVKLQILVRIIDAQLFKTVFCEIFEAEDVQDRNGSCLFGALINNMIDTSN